jgi:hypothetical protein
LLTWREIGVGWLAANAQQIARALAEKILQEVSDGENNQT